LQEKGLIYILNPALPTNFGVIFAYGILFLFSGKKFGPDGIMDDYGFFSKINDAIGILLEFKQGLGTLSFYKNGSKCGIAFSDLTGVFVPAITMFYGDV